MQFLVFLVVTAILIPLKLHPLTTEASQWTNTFVNGQTHSFIIQDALDCPRVMSCVISAVFGGNKAVVLFVCRKAAFPFYIFWFSEDSVRMADHTLDNPAVSYSSLSRAQLTVEYLHTNSTTHEFLFGALAELVDNARDAGATKMEIFSVAVGYSVELKYQTSVGYGGVSVPNNAVLGKFLLCFCDDGEGMDPTEVSNVIQFGRSTKRIMDSKMIGQYGNGLKSGSMRIGKDMILFTKKHGTMSCLFLSRSFYEREGISEVVVPIPSWDTQTKKPLAKSKQELEKHQEELQLILRYSPFQTTNELFEYFDKINGKAGISLREDNIRMSPSSHGISMMKYLMVSVFGWCDPNTREVARLEKSVKKHEPLGTLVITYNLKLLDSGETELEPSDDDIKMREFYEDQIDDRSVMPERKSFRAYSAILYLDPIMKIYIQGKKVITTRLGDCLCKPKSYCYTSKRFKTRSEHEASKAMVEAKSAADKARELENSVKEMREENQVFSKESRAMLRQAQDTADKARTDAEIKNKIATTKQKSLKEPKTLTFTFGFNINRRHSYGLFIYNCNRIIKMYEKAVFHSNGTRAYNGIVGFVDVPYLVLEPTHNKQDFADAKEYKHLLRSMGEHLSQYWKDSGVTGNNANKFWENFGYVSNDIDEVPSDQPKYVRKRAMQLPYSVQCVECLKWRVLPFSAKNVGKIIDDNWVCSLNTDPDRNKCSALEQRSSIPIGYLQKPVKTQQEKQREIIEDIKKKQEKLGQLNGRSKRDYGVEEKQEERPVKRVPPRSVTPPTRILPKTTPTRTEAKSTPKTVPKPAKPTAKLVPIARSESRDETNVNRSTVSSSNKRDHPVLDKDICEVQPKRKRDEVIITSTQDIQESDEGLFDNSDVQKPDETRAISKLSKYKVNAKVDVKVSKVWYAAKVVAVKHRKNAPAKIKVKFDNYQKDKYDKWFDETDTNLKLFDEEYPVSHDIRITSPISIAPTSTTALDSPPPVVAIQEPTITNTSLSSNETSIEQSVKVLDELLRTCISYMLVPDFPTTGDEVKKLSLEELKKFPLDKLFAVHSNSIKQIVNDKSKDMLSNELFEKEKELEELKRSEKECKEKLTNLRRTAAKLIRSLNENPDESSVALNDDTERVDVLLENIAEQASASDQS